MLRRVTAVLVVLLAAGVMGGAAQAATNPVIDWSPVEAFAFEPNFVLPHQSLAGNMLTIVGKVDIGFQAPLNGNDITVPGVEYTFVFDELVSQGGVFFEQGNFDQWKTNYSGGRIRVFKDVNANRAYGINPPNLASPSTFEDGELILEGMFLSFKTVSNAYVPNNNGGNYDGTIVFTGGTQLPLLGNEICGRLLGVWQRGLIQMPVGYIRACDGKIDIFSCETPVESRTWGEIKVLYR